ncbi:substrate-binding domain-containing protein [bacterium]|nr:substrate-binding domain-containing protein [bacterium]
MKRTRPQRNILYLPFSIQPQYYTGIAQYAGQHGWHLNADPVRSGKIPYGWEGDGIITLLGDDPEGARYVTQQKVPFVDLSMARSDIPAARVAKDNVMIGKFGARHFLEQGWHSFVFFSREDNHVCRLRVSGYRQEIEHNGFSCRELIWPRTAYPEHERWDVVCRWLIEQLGSMPKPVAVMAYSDYDAAMVVDACAAGGFPIPHDVGVLGVDDIPEVCQCLSMPLSSIRTEGLMVGYRAAELLDRILDGGNAPEEPILIAPGGIAQRQSTSRLVLRNPQLQQAIKQIEEHISQPFAMEQIADTVGVSRKGLYNIFARELHQTPVEFVIRKRMERARDLLLDSEDSIGDVGRQCGMPVLSTFIRQFRIATGLTPGEWRRRYQTSK